MPIYPFCVIGDVQAHNQHRDTYSTSTKPTSTQVLDYMLRISAQIKAIAKASGYDVDNFYEVSTTVALAITSGDDKEVVTANASELSEGDLIKIEGLTNGVRAWEFTEIEVISSNTITIDVANSYDASSVTIYLINGALLTLREINAVGAAWKAEESAFMGVSPNKSEHAEALQELYFGNEENMSGLWAIKNIPEYLEGATRTDDAKIVRSSMSSLGTEKGESDTLLDEDDIEPIFTKDMDF